MKTRNVQFLTFRTLAPVIAAVLLLGGSADADEIKVMTSGAFTAAYLELVPEFERASRNKVVTAFGASMGNAPDSIPSRLQRGEPVDVVILSAAALDDLIRQGKVVAGSRVDLVRSAIGMAVRSGAPRPDISSVAALTRTLLQATSIAYSASASGVYLSTELFQRLGIADQVKGKSRRIESERVGAVVARGEAEIGFQQVSELLPVPGIEYVGPLPAEVQQVTVFSAGVAAGAKDPETARALIAYLASPAAAAAITKSGLEPVGQGGDGAPSALTGAIDIHVHSSPDDRPRSLDAMEVTRLARARGMRGIVLKNHYESTAGLVYLVRKEIPGIEVFGGIDLNLTVGGINPAAVEHMTRVSGGWGRIVWMPTFDAENQVRYSKENRRSVPVSRNGELLPEVREVIALIAKNGLVLATGHSAAAEVLMILREGQRQGVRRMVVTHAMNPPILMTVSQMQEAAKLGAFIEFVGGSLAAPEASARMDAFADAIRQIGPQFCILSSDLGQVGNALPPDGFGQFLAALRAKGFTDQEIARMSKENPSQLLGLP